MFLFAEMETDAASQRSMPGLDAFGVREFDVLTR